MPPHGFRHFQESPGEAWTTALLALGAAMAMAVALQILEAARHPVWFTEIYNLLAVHRPFGDMLRLFAADIHPPLPGVLRWGLAALGGGEIAQKAMSIAFTAGSLVPTFTLGRRLFGTRAGLLAAFLVALPRTAIHYGQEIEDFSLLWLLTASLAHFAFAWFDEQRTRDLVGYVLVATMACYSHYVALVVVSITALLGVVWLRRDRDALRHWLLMQVLVAFFFAPQIPTAMEQFAREGIAAHSHFPGAETLRSLRPAG